MEQGKWNKWPGVEAFPKGVREAREKGIPVYIRYKDGITKEAGWVWFVEPFMWNWYNDEADVVAYKIGDE